MCVPTISSLLQAKKAIIFLNFKTTENLGGNVIITKKDDDDDDETVYNCNNDSLYIE